jgi:hypothetical protein
MIMLLILKGLGLVEYFLDYLIQANITVLKGTNANEFQWQLHTVNVFPTAKGWAIMDDIWTVIHNALDMLAQFSTLLPVNGANSGYIGNDIVGFPGVMTAQ